MSLSVRGSNKGEREKGVCICMRVYIGVGAMEVWVIRICTRVYIG